MQTALVLGAVDGGLCLGGFEFAEAGLGVDVDLELGVALVHPGGPFVLGFGVSFGGGVR